ncbi:MAG TPA: hypothetical protein VGJ09_11390 [Bryobacteraceae bacterium]
MSRPRDLQIVWVVLAAAFFWMFVWQHELMVKWWKTASTAAIAMTSGLRAGPSPSMPVPTTPAAAVHPAGSKKAPSSAATKD